MKTLIMNLIKLCRISNDSTDEGDLPIQQVEYQEKTADALRYMPYGIDANIPEDALGILLNLMGQEQNRVVLPISPKERPKNLETGDVVLYSPITGEKILFKASGGIFVSGNVTYENDITYEGDVTYNGNVSVAGDLDVTGDTTLGANVTSNGKDISDTHTHNGSPTAPTGAITPTGVPV